MARITKFKLIKQIYLNEGAGFLLRKCFYAFLRRTIINNFPIAILNVCLSEGLVKFLMNISSTPLNIEIKPRYKVIQKYLKKINSRPIRALEIGTWCAEGSTRIIASSIEQIGELYCIDKFLPWHLMASKKNFTLSQYNRNIKVAYLIAYFNCQKLSKKFKIPIYLIMGDSEVLLQKQSFNFIYIDGDHTYQSFLKDINRALELITNNGFIVCDDFEVRLPFKKGLIDECKKNINEDLIFSKIENEYVHPGIVLGVYDILNNKKHSLIIKSENGCCIIFRG